MSREKADQDIEAGRLGVARDRLRECQRRDPANLEIRALLADVNWKLGYPIEAGRWWFFRQDLDEIQLEAVEKFLKSCHRNPAMVLRKLQLPSAEKFAESKVQERIRELEAACVEAGLEVPSPKPSSTVTSSKWEGLGLGGCLLVVVICFAIFAYGLVSLVQLLLFRSSPTPHPEQIASAVHRFGVPAGSPHDHPVRRES